ncbi:aminoacetone oxidase family FAD-binding enzyme [Desulfovibrio sp. OttesenSCG-928-O18]|nr:aminoacetone oxidase family FAD-binding enzyme [Desulfovibrio sp. OttesenSCG-928-O18]
MERDIIIMGAGPAGLTAAIHACRAGKRVLVLDKAGRAGTKLLLAGGGKGNVTNRHVETTDYIGGETDFAGYALSRVTPEAVLRQLEEAGIPLEEREHGRIFCTTSARAVLNLLLAQLPPERCRIAPENPVTGITATGGVFAVTCENTTYRAPRLVAATGSPAWPQCGADDSGLRLIRALGHRIVPPRPVLAPLVMPPQWPLAGLAGISLPVRIRCDTPQSPLFEDALLFTHKGISGPAALQASCWWSKGSAVHIDFLPGEDAEKLLDRGTGKATPQSVLARRLPERLTAALLPAETATRRVAELSRKQRTAIADAVHRHSVIPLRTEGLTKAEAAAGGVDTREVDPFTMHSRLVPGLFFCGEILDVTGRLGGYNLHWAWASGTVAGESAAR